MFRCCLTAECKFHRFLSCVILSFVSLASIVLVSAAGRADQLPTANLANLEQSASPAANAAPLSADLAQVAIVHTSNFGPDEDSNGDGWPDAWRRVFDRQHPKYIAIRTENRNHSELSELQQTRRSLAQWILAIDQGRRPGDVVPEQIPAPLDKLLEMTIMNRCLQVQMNGGAAMIESNLFPIDRRFRYRVTAEMKCVDLDGFDAQLSLIGIDADQHATPLSTSIKLTGTRDWTTISLPNIAITDDNMVSAKLRLEVNPSSFQALHGTLMFDSVRVERRPKLSVVLDPPTHIVRAGERITARCEVTGLDNPQSQVQFLIRDVDRKIQQRVECAVESKMHSSVTEVTADNSSARFIGTCEQELAFPEPGFFELVVSLDDSRKQDFQQTLTIAVLPTEELIATGHNPRFGLSIENAGREMRWQDAIRLANELCVGHLKIPVWVDTSISQELTTLNWALDVMNNQQIRPIAVLDRPPTTQANKFPGESGSSLIESLDMPAIWQPMLDPILQRITLHVQDFQLGWDTDISTLHDSKLPSILQNFRSKLNSYEPEAKLTLASNITAKETSQDSKLINRFQLFAQPGLTAEEIENYSEALKKTASNRWLSLAPLDDTKYTRESVLIDLTRQMLATSKSNFPIGFFTRLRTKSLFDEQGRPGSLYLPIRNLSNWLRDSSSYEIINVSPNQTAILLDQGGRSDLLLMPVEGDYKPNRFWLGRDLQAVDIWGRRFEISVDPAITGQPIILPNVTWPILIRDVSESLIRWQSAVELAFEDLVMTTTSTVKLAIDVNNPASARAMGMVRIVAPQLLREEEVELRVDVGPLERKTFEADILLRSDVAEGETPVRLFVAMDSDRDLAFELERMIHVGLPGIRISSKSMYSPQNDLIIDVTLENQTGQPTSFDMLLFLPGRPRERAQMIRVKDTQVRRIVVPNASELRGQTLRLSCEEIGTARTINHLVRVEF